MDRKLLIQYLIDLIDLVLAADDDDWCPDLAEHARRESNPQPPGS